MLLLPNCKINIGLNVVRRRPDGYHDLETVFYPVPLRDNLDFRELREPDVPYRLLTAGARIEGEAADNLVVKVYLSLKEEFSLPPLEISLYKKIPMGAGLGGGSSDAAFMMTGLNEYYRLGLSDGEMERRLVKFGADCPFFVRNKPAFATGVGDELTPCGVSLRGMHLVLVKPDVSVSTREAYASVKPGAAAVPLRKAVAQPVEVWKDCVANDFERSVFPQHPELAAIKRTLYDMGALYASMSGSGSTMYGLFSRPVPEAEKVFAGHYVFMKRLAQ